jgi:hypothetical protein
MKDLRPATAREALFQVRLELGQPILDSETCQRLDRICREGLDLSGMSNFELVDQVTDRYAKAYWLLERVQRADLSSIPDQADLRGEIGDALVLPPDIEAMMDRRRPRG